MGEFILKSVVACTPHAAPAGMPSSSSAAAAAAAAPGAGAGGGAGPSSSSSLTAARIVTPPSLNLPSILPASVAEQLRKAQSKAALLGQVRRQGALLA